MLQLNFYLLNLEGWWNRQTQRTLDTKSQIGAVPMFNTIKILWINFRAGSSPVPSTNDAVAKRKGKRAQSVDRKLKSLLRLKKMTLLRGGNSCSNVQGSDNKVSCLLSGVERRQADMAELVDARASNTLVIRRVSSNLTICTSRCGVIGSHIRFRF